MPWLMEPPHRKHTALSAHLQVAHLPATHVCTAAHADVEMVRPHGMTAGFHQPAQSPCNATLPANTQPGKLAQTSPPSAHLHCVCRWAKERYEKAQRSVVAALRRLGGTAGGMRGCWGSMAWHGMPQLEAWHGRTCKHRRCAHHAI